MFFFAQHEGVWGSRSASPLIINLGTSWRWVVNYTHRLLYHRDKVSRYPLNRMLDVAQVRAGRFGEEINILLLPIIGRPTSSLVSVPTELSRLPLPWNAAARLGLKRQHVLRSGVLAAVAAGTWNRPYVTLGTVLLNPSRENPIGRALAYMHIGFVSPYHAHLLPVLRCLRLQPDSFFLRLLVRLTPFYQLRTFYSISGREIYGRKVLWPKKHFLHTFLLIKVY